MAIRSSSPGPKLPVEGVLLEQAEKAFHGGVVAGWAVSIATRPGREDPDHDRQLRRNVDELFARARSRRATCRPIPEHPADRPKHKQLAMPLSSTSSVVFSMTSIK